MTAFVTKDSGERQTFASGMQRDTGAKPLRPDLIYQPMLDRWANVLEATSTADASVRREHALDFFRCWFNDRGGAVDVAAECLRAISDVERLCERPPMLVRWAELMGRGAMKYGERNWEKACSVEELERFKASAFRHMLQWYYGLDKEEDHAAAVFFNIAGAERTKVRIIEEGAAKVDARAKAEAEKRAQTLTFRCSHIEPW
jgi:hypothetical protein